MITEIRGEPFAVEWPDVFISDWEIRDHFEYVQSGIQGMLNTLKADLAEPQEFCQGDPATRKSRLADLGGNPRMPLRVRA